MFAQRQRLDFHSLHILNTQIFIHIHIDIHIHILDWLRRPGLMPLTVFQRIREIVFLPRRNAFETLISYSKALRFSHNTMIANLIYRPAK